MKPSNGRLIHFYCHSLHLDEANYFLHVVALSAIPWRHTSCFISMQCSAGVLFRFKLFANNSGKKATGYVLILDSNPNETEVKSAPVEFQKFVEIQRSLVPNSASHRTFFCNITDLQRSNFR